MLKKVKERNFYLACFFILVICVPGFANGGVAELFAKGYYRKSNHTQTSNTITVSASAGLAFTLIPRIRLEGRYSKIRSVQNILDISGSGTVTDFVTNTDIYSVGIDFDLLGKEQRFRPFIFVGVGYLETARSYGFTPLGSTTVTDVSEPKRQGFTGNAAIGFQLVLAKSLAFEAELFAYSSDLDEASPLIDYTANFGFRIYI